MVSVATADPRHSGPDAHKRVPSQDVAAIVLAGIEIRARDCADLSSPLLPWSGSDAASNAPGRIVWRPGLRSAAGPTWYTERCRHRREHPVKGTPRFPPVRSWSGGMRSQIRGGGAGTDAAIRVVRGDSEFSSLRSCMCRRRCR